MSLAEIRFVAVFYGRRGRHSWGALAVTAVLDIVALTLAASAVGCTLIGAPGWMQVGSAVAAVGLGALGWWASCGYASTRYCAQAWAASR